MGKGNVFCSECAYFVDYYLSSPVKCKHAITGEIIKTFRGMEKSKKYELPMSKNKNNDCIYFKKKKVIKILLDEWGDRIW